MGTTFTAIYNHNCSNVKDIYIKLNKLTGYKINQQTNKWMWFLEDVDKSIEDNLALFGHITMAGPEGQEFNVGRCTLEYSSLISWKAFLTDDVVQNKVRKWCFEISQVFGSAIYIPSNYDFLSYVYEGETWDDLLDRLFKNYGQPSSYISDMYVALEGMWESEGYYLDYFKDLKI